MKKLAIIIVVVLIVIGISIVLGYWQPWTQQQGEGEPTSDTTTGDEDSSDDDTSGSTASAWIFEYDNEKFYVYLTSFNRRANPGREGWDKVDAQFSVFRVPQDRFVDDLFDLPILQNASVPDLVELVGPGSNYLGIKLSWDGGSVESFRWQTELNDDYFFRALPAIIEADVPNAAKNIQLVPVVNGKVKIHSGTSEMPRVWGDSDMRAEYRNLFSRHLVTTLDGFSTDTVELREVNRKVEGRYVVFTVNIKNKSMDSDLDLTYMGLREIYVSATSWWALLLAADGTLLDDITDEFQLESDRDVLPPGFETTGVLRLPLNVSNVAYVALNIALGKYDFTGYKVLAIP